MRLFDKLPWLALALAAASAFAQDAQPDAAPADAATAAVVVTIDSGATAWMLASSLLVLFMTAALTSGGFGFDRQTASSITGIYAASVYLASLPGGWIADRWLGLRRAIWHGGVLIALGHLSIALSAV